MEQRRNAAPGAHPYCSGVRSGAERYLPVIGTRGPALGRPEREVDDREEKSSSIPKSDSYQDTLLFVRVTLIHL